MVNCSSVGCTNRSNDRPDLSFHRIPTDGKIWKQWLTNMRRDGKLPKTIIVCTEHFECDCFICDLQVCWFRVYLISFIIRGHPDIM